MADHTRGPWYYTARNDGSFEVHSDVEGRGPMIATRCLWTRNAKASQANARLIAAAPELLAACEGFLAAFALDGKVNHKYLDMARAMAEDAIDKARKGNVDD